MDFHKEILDKLRMNLTPEEMLMVEERLEKIRQERYKLLSEDARIIARLAGRAPKNLND